MRDYRRVWHAASFSGLTLLAATTADAELVEVERVVREFHYALFDGYHPLLVAGFGNQDGVLAPVESGEVFISCFDGRVDAFRLNIVLRSPIASRLPAMGRYWIGMRESEGETTTIVGSGRPLSAAEFGDIIGVSALEEMYTEVVRDFSPIEVYEHELVYFSSFPNAKFYRALVEGSEMLVLKQGGTGEVSVAISFPYRLSEDVSDHFLKECLDM